MKKTIENEKGEKQEVELMDYGREYDSGAFVIIKKKGKTGDIITVSAKSRLFSFTVKDKNGLNQPYFLLDYGVANEDWHLLVQAYILDVFSVGNIVRPEFHTLVMTAINAYMDNIAPLPDNPDADKRAIEIQEKMDVVRQRIDEAIEKMRSIDLGAEEKNKEG